MKPSTLIDRRHFVRQSATAAIGTGGWMTGLRDLVERARQQDRPVLTDANFTSFIRNLRAQGAKATQHFVDALRADMRSAVRDRFTLTAAQDQGLGAFTPIQKTTIVGAFDRGFAGRNELVVALPNRTQAANCRVTASRTLRQLDRGQVAEVWALTFSE